MSSSDQQLGAELPSPCQELAIRQLSARIWDQAHSRFDGLDPKQAFAEGYYIGIASGILAVKQVKREARKESRKLENLLNVAAISLLSLFALHFLDK